MSWQVETVDDSFHFMRELLPADHFDVIITDPPYNAHVQANQISGTDVKANGGGIGVPHLELPFAPLAGYDFAKDLVRIAKRWALSFCAVEDFGEFKRAVPDAYRRGAIWYKPNAQGQMTGDRPAACYEGIACMHAGAPRWNGHGSYGLWVCNGTRGEPERHPNQKPLELCLKLVALFSDRGETVFDPFCGSGRIGEACILLGRKYIGLDLPEHDWTHVVMRNGKREKITERVDWVKVARTRLAVVQDLWGSVSDEEALKLCTAKKQEILEIAC